MEGDLISQRIEEALSREKWFSYNLGFKDSEKSWRLRPFGKELPKDDQEIVLWEETIGFHRESSNFDKKNLSSDGEYHFYDESYPVNSYSDSPEHFKVSYSHWMPKPQILD